MAFSIDNKPLTITCPKCGKKINKTVRWFKASGRKCPSCGQGFDTTQFRRDVDEMEKHTEKTLREIKKTLGSIKINIKL